MTITACETYCLTNTTESRSYAGPDNGSLVSEGILESEKFIGGPVIELFIATGKLTFDHVLNSRRASAEKVWRAVEVYQDSLIEQEKYFISPRETSRCASNV